LGGGHIPKLGGFHRFRVSSLPSTARVSIRAFSTTNVSNKLSRFIYQSRFVLSPKRLPHHDLQDASGNLGGVVVPVVAPSDGEGLLCVPVE
jgi:hypothetical protein